jgi:enamine deaminase RidA (YjgF/YER057c/UK114 family)
VTCGEFVFVAGQTAEALDSGNGPLDPEACMPAGHLWKGTPIKLETEFVIRRKLKPALESVGNTLAEVVKAQVYLRDVDDIPAFNEVWSAHFGNSPPATSIITTATPGFICEASRIEINTISVRRGGATRKEIVDAEVPMPYAGQVQAVRAGELLFLSNLMAVDASGALAVRANAPEQVDHMLAAAERLCSSSTPTSPTLTTPGPPGSTGSPATSCRSRRSRCRRSRYRGRSSCSICGSTCPRNSK